MKSPEVSNRKKLREWSPGFWERMDALAVEIEIGAPERLPSSEHRYAIFDEGDVPRAAN